MIRGERLTARFQSKKNCESVNSVVSGGAVQEFGVETMVCSLE